MKPAHLTEVPAPRHKPGRGSQVTPSERREIQQLFLVDGLTKADIAKKMGRTRETIASALQGEDFERFRQEIESELFETAQRKLKSNVGRAADGWIKAIDKAAERGDHKPSKDLLMHTKVIDPLGQHGAQGALVLVGVRVDINGKVNAWQDRGGRVYEQEDLAAHAGVKVFVGMGLPGGVPLEPPSQEEIEAAQREREALTEPVMQPDAHSS